MDSSFQRYIWRHTRPQQLWVLSVVALSMVPYYLAFDLPKRIVNGPIMGTEFEGGATQGLFPATLDLPFVGPVLTLPDIELDRTGMLVGLSVLFLGLVIVNGLFKYYINIYKGLLGERLLRRLRYELVDRILRFRPEYFRRVKGAEMSTMVKDEVEPLGGFTGDAFVQPAFLGGQALTALAFILVQNVWLGMIAAAMAGVQLALIPRLRRKLLELGRERQLTARLLAGRVNEIVDGITTIHANDTSNYERADLSNRLGTIFRIRYEIYKRKFMVKFINNFLAQLTPFLFYLIGGWFAIEGRLDVGQLVAVINAYKELPGPLKELIDWDLARQDVQVKYEQVWDQFSKGELLDAGLQRVQAGEVPPLTGALTVAGLVIEDDSGTRRLNPVSLTVEQGQRVALVGEGESGAGALAEAIGRVAWPMAGRIHLGDTDLFSLPESVSGRRMTYVGSEGYFFYGSLRDNLLYGLKHAPVADSPLGDAAAQRLRRWALREAQMSGNPELDPAADWLDAGRLRGGQSGAVDDAIRAVLDVVHLTDAVLDVALNSTAPQASGPDFANRIVQLRSDLQAQLIEQGLDDLVAPFREGEYNIEARVIDNLLFGLLTSDQDPKAVAEATAFFEAMLRDSGLDETLFGMGVSIAETTLELVADLPAGHALFDRLTYLDPEDLPALLSTASRLRGLTYAKAEPEDRIRFRQLALRYCERRHRFGVLTEATMANVVELRGRLAAEIPAHLRELLEPYAPDRYLSGASLFDNIVFGRIVQGREDAERQVRRVLAGLMDADPDLRGVILARGLDYNIGAAGRRLTLAQRQKLGLARALLRHSDVYVFNRPLGALDPVEKAQILDATLHHLADEIAPPTVLWALSDPGLTDRFDRVLRFADGSLVEEEGGDMAEEAAQ